MPQASRHILLFIEVSDVPGGIITARGAARLRTRVTRARETVTGLVTAGSMTATPAAEATWSAGATTAGSLVCITMRRTTAARGRAPGEGGQEAPALGQGARGGLAGPSGAASAPAAPPAAWARSRGRGCAPGLSAAQHFTPRRHRSDPVLASFVEEEVGGQSSIIFSENNGFVQI